MSQLEPHPARPEESTVVVVGPCASGKTTLANNLRNLGIDVHVVGQEHSAVKRLWARRNPDVVIALDVDLASLRQRRGPTWPSALYREQHERLRSAYAAATVILDTSTMSEADVLVRSLKVIHEHLHR